MPAHLIAEEGPQRGQVLNFSSGEDWIVGRDPDEADFVLEDSTVSRKHARFSKTTEGIHFKNLSRTNPAQVNGETASGLILLKEGDKIQIGSTLFLFSEEEIPSATPTSPSMYDSIFESIEEDTADTKQGSSAYDTIFEEGREEPEIPFHLLAEAPYILKVVAGPNAGAEIGVEKGKSYVLGKDPNACDIAFQDMSVSRNHARLTVEKEGTLWIEDLESKNGTYLNSQEVKEKTEVKAFDMIALGTTAFYVLDQNAPQETLFSPMTAEETSTPPLEEEVPKEEKIPEAVPSDWRKIRIQGRYLVLGGALVATFLIVFLTFFSLFKPGDLTVAQNEPQKEIETVLKKYPGVRSSFNPASGKLFLVGHVLTSIDYSEMTYLLDQVEGLMAIENGVIIDELVTRSMNEVIASNAAWGSVSIRSLKPGSFVVTGYLPTQNDSAILADYLNLHFPYLDKLQYRVITEDALSTQLEGLLATANLGAVAIQLSNGEVILSGRYDESRAKNLKVLLEEINRLPGVAKVQNFAVATDANSAAFDISDQFQVGGIADRKGSGYSVVLNGKLYTLGQSVEGMKIAQIDSNMILLEKDGLKYKIEYTR